MRLTKRSMLGTFYPDDINFLRSVLIASEKVICNPEPPWGMSVFFHRIVRKSRDAMRTYRLSVSSKGRNKVVACQSFIGEILSRA